MKIKIFILSLICCFAFGNIAAQESKTIKIAILETIDKANEVEYAKRLLVRSTLAKAITATPGFEAYDRVDLNSIFGEQDFQRTGNVSNDQIKELGRMIGAQYIMVAEIAKMDIRTYYITAKILDVETAQAINIQDVITSSEVANMQMACSKMASDLLELPEIAQKKQQTTQQRSSRVTSTPTSGIYMAGGHLTQLGLEYDRKKYYRNGYPINRSEVNKIALADMKINDEYGYDYYRRKSKNVITAGWSLFGSGLLLAGFVGPMCLIADIGKNYHPYPGTEACLSICGIGVLIMVSGIPCLSVGYVRRDKICDGYLLGNPNNPKYAHYMPNGENQPYITFSPALNGLGVAMNF